MSYYKDTIQNSKTPKKSKKKLDTYLIYQKFDWEKNKHGTYKGDQPDENLEVCKKEFIVYNAAKDGLRVTMSLDDRLKAISVYLSNYNRK